MQDRVTICNNSDGKKYMYARLAVFFITIPAECHLDQLLVSTSVSLTLTNIIEVVKNK